MEYVEEIMLNLNKKQILEIITDPYRLAGIVGHLVLLRVKDGEDNKFKSPNLVKKPLNEYLGVLVFRDEGGDIETLDITLRGPTILPNSVGYEGKSNDNKVSFKLEFNFLPSSTSTTRLSIRGELNLKLGFFERMLSADIREAATPEHIIKAHITPYLKSLRAEKEELNLILLDSKELELEEAIRLIKNLPKVIGFISIRGEEYVFTGYINNGELFKEYLKFGDKEYTDEMALGKLLTLSGKVKVEVYEIPVYEFLKGITSLENQIIGK